MKRGKIVEMSLEIRTKLHGRMFTGSTDYHGPYGASIATLGSGSQFFVKTDSFIGTALPHNAYRKSNINSYKDAVEGVVIIEE